MNRIGIGYDLHRLKEGRDLVLGGVKIDHHQGLEGHSDADVLVHALMDALLGAAGKRDIGFFFPPGDDRYKGISSIELLKSVKSILDSEEWSLINADIVVVAEKPLLLPYVEKMSCVLSDALDVPAGTITIKATTTEGLGPCGREEAIAAQAVALLGKNNVPGKPELEV